MVNSAWLKVKKNRRNIIESLIVFSVSIIGVSVLSWFFSMKYSFIKILGIACLPMLVDFQFFKSKDK